MKIICTENEEEWIKKLMLESDHCDLDCHCDLLGQPDKITMYNICNRCIEENIEFEIEEKEE